MSAVVINTNTQALNTHRNLQNVDRRLKTSLEHLSSGEKIVRAADGPAALMISEQLRAQVASVNQAIDNTETSVSMVQTTEASLDEISKLLVSVRQLAIHAANEGANDQQMLEADQFEIDNALQSIDRISQFAAFGKKKILDGSAGVNGVAAGENLTFLQAGTRTQASPDEGYNINIMEGATRASHTGETALTPEMIDGGVTLTVKQDGKVARYTTQEGETASTIVRNLQNVMDRESIEVTASHTEDNRLTLTHKEYGSQPEFTVISSEAGVLSNEEGQPLSVSNGRDVRGSIGGQVAQGTGRVLEGGQGTDAEGLQVLYTGGTPDNTEEPVGRVQVSQNALNFQIGPDVGQKVRVALNAMNTRTLGLNVDNDSGFKSLSDANVMTAQGAEDVMRLVDKAIDDVNKARGELGAIQKNALESNIRSLGVTREELTNAESVIRDADMAMEVSEFTRNQIIMQSATAMLSQANQVPRNVLSLIQGL